MKHLDIVLVGKVQRVGLRFKIKLYAEELSLHGYARNITDGSVFIEVEGDESSTDEFTRWLRSSPGLSEIKNLEMNEGKIKYYRDFQIY